MWCQPTVVIPDATLWETSTLLFVPFCELEFLVFPLATYLVGVTYLLGSMFSQIAGFVMVHRKHQASGEIVLHPQSTTYGKDLQHVHQLICSLESHIYFIWNILDSILHSSTHIKFGHLWTVRIQIQSPSSSSQDHI
jgi:hypothetical protein